jgi:uncharacterized protein (TIGR03083 family)
MQESRVSQRSPRLVSQAYLPGLEQAARQFAQLLAVGDLEAPVPPCPGWHLADLAGHLGRIHQWANHAVVEGNPDAVTTAAPNGRDELVEWYRNAAGTLLETLRATEPDVLAWGFGPKPRTALFWHRRQLHETTVHLWDAGASQGAPVSIDGALALDGVDEVVSMFFPRQVRLGRAPALERSLALASDGSDGGLHRWVLAGDGNGPPSAPDAPAEATVSGPVEALLLLLWGRISLDDARLALAGDETAARAVLNSAITP